MRNVAVIARRELGAYFQSAIGFIFLIAFVLLGNLFYIWTYFLNPTSDMRDYFGMLPFFLCVLLPAITMRSWAEERKENTLEMLLTFPMRVGDLVLGKFVASLVFLAVAMACSLTIPLMIATLCKNPDWGPTAAGYFGAFSLGAFYLSLGLFFSALSKDQIVSFLVSVMGCFGLYLAGTEFVSAPLDGWWSGLGRFVSMVLGVAEHYNPFARGVVEIVDVVFFGGWTVVFLLLNWMYLEGRGHPGEPMPALAGIPVRVGKESFTRWAATGLIVALGLAGNWVLGGESLGRFDLTEDRIYTVSDATRRILAELKVPVQVKLYITPADKMPTEMRNLEREITDKLDEMRISGGGNLEYRAIHMEAANVIASDEEMFDDPDKKKDGKKSKEDVLEKRLLDKGVRPFPIRALREDQTVTQMVYSAVGIAYKDQKEEIIPRLMPQMMDQLEYLLTNIIYKLTREKRPKIALVAPVSQMDPRMARIYAQMGRPVQQEDAYSDVQRLLQSEKYEVARVSLTPQEPLPDEYDTLLILEPKSFNERQRWEIARALRAGKSVVVAAQNFTWNYRVSGEGFYPDRQEEKPEIDELLANYGVTLDPGVLMDANHETLMISDPNNPMAQLMGGGMDIKLPMHVVVTSNSMNPNHAISARVDQIFYLWGSALRPDEKTWKEKNLKGVTLFSSSERSWILAPEKKLGQNDTSVPSQGLKSYPLAVLLTGQFADPWAGKQRPKWPAPMPEMGEAAPPPQPEDMPSPEITSQPGQLLVVGCSQMFHKSFLLSVPGNADFALNAVDALTLGNDIVEVRGKKRIERVVEKPSAIGWWKFLHLGLVNLLIAGVGITGAFFRRRGREAYTVSHAA